MVCFFTTSMVCLCRLSWKMRERRQRNSGGGGWVGSSSGSGGEDDMMDFDLDIAELEGEMGGAHGASMIGLKHSCIAVSEEEAS